MAKALRCNDLEYAAKLLQCSLCLTLKMRVEDNPAALIAYSCMYSESLKAQQMTCADTFCNFVDKLKATGIAIGAGTLNTFQDIAQPCDSIPSEALGGFVRGRSGRLCSQCPGLEPPLWRRGD